MDHQIFRKKSMDRISSPEQLDGYLRASNPGAWMVLAAVLVLLVGACVWGIFGHMDTKLTVCVVSDETGVVCYVPENRIAEVNGEFPVQVGQESYGVSDVSMTSVATDDLDDYILHVGGLQRGEWVCALQLEGDAPHGVYAGQLVLDSVSPISFILN